MTADRETSTVIGRDVACARCGYNLRTLSAADVCPECGLPVAESMEPDSLARAPRRWLARLKAGVWLLAAAYLLCGLAIAAEMLRTFAPWLTDARMTFVRVAPLIGLVIAVWLLTTPRPERAARRIDWLLRGGFVGMVGLALLLPTLNNEAFQTPVERAGWAVFFGTMVACWIGLGAVQARLARALGLRWLVAWVWLATAVWSASLAATGVFYVFREFTRRALFSRAEPAYVNLLVVGGVLVTLCALVLAIAFSFKPRASRA